MQHAAPIAAFTLTTNGVGRNRQSAGTELADTSPDVTYVADQLVVGFEESATKAEVSEAVAGVEGTVTESLPALVPPTRTAPGQPGRP